MADDSNFLADLYDSLKKHPLPEPRIAGPDPYPMFQQIELREIQEVDAADLTWISTDVDGTEIHFNMRRRIIYKYDPKGVWYRFYLTPEDR